MKFDHLVEINDPLNPMVAPLTLLQLWSGLVLRAEAPGLFVPWLDRSEVRANDHGGLDRVLHYGEVPIHDHVGFTPQQRIDYLVPAQGEMAASRLTVSIEAPQPERLFVRFSYDDGIAEEAGSMDAFYNEFRRSAYQEADIDTIRLIRQFAAEGRFDNAAP